MPALNVHLTIELFEIFRINNYKKGSIQENGLNPGNKSKSYTKEVVIIPRIERWKFFERRSL